MINTKRGWAAILIPLLTAATAARADGPTTMPAPTDNLLYASWAKFKPGSSATLAGDADLTAMGGTGMSHMEVKQALKAVSPESVTYEAVVTTPGQAQPPRPFTIAAKQTIVNHEAGTADVVAMGRTFACKVYENPVPGGGLVKLYWSPDVPGGTVKVEAPAPAGKTSTLTLTAMDVK